MRTCSELHPLSRNLPPPRANLPALEFAPAHSRKPHHRPRHFHGANFLPAPCSPLASHKTLNLAT